MSEYGDFAVFTCYDCASFYENSSELERHADGTGHKNTSVLKGSVADMDGKRFLVFEVT